MFGRVEGQYTTQGRHRGLRSILTKSGCWLALSFLLITAPGFFSLLLRLCLYSL